MWCSYCIETPEVEYPDTLHYLAFLIVELIFFSLWAVLMRLTVDAIVWPNTVIPFHLTPE